jgi:hypothetical protein
MQVRSTYSESRSLADISGLQERERPRVAERHNAPPTVRRRHTVTILSRNTSLYMHLRRPCLLVPRFECARARALAAWLGHLLRRFKSQSQNRGSYLVLTVAPSVLCPDTSTFAIGPQIFVLLALTSTDSCVPCTSLRQETLQTIVDIVTFDSYFLAIDLAVKHWLLSA